MLVSAAKLFFQTKPDRLTMAASNGLATLVPPTKFQPPNVGVLKTQTPEAISATAARSGTPRWLPTTAETTLW